MIRRDPLDGQTLRARLAGPPPELLTLHWLGQAGFAVRLPRPDPRVVIIDPYLSDYLARKYAGRVYPHQRMMPPPVRAEDLPRVDLVLCTHRHSDHMDPGTLPVLAKRHPNARFVVPEAERDHAVGIGVPSQRIIGADVGARIEPLPGIVIDPVASAHEELSFDLRGRSRFLGYILRADGRTVYHSGDCVPYEGLSDALDGAGIDVALLPVNGRDEVRLRNGVPGNFHLHEAVELCRAAGIPALVCHHFGMFDFNTVDVARVDAAIAADETDLVWVRPEVGDGYALAAPGGERP